MKVHLGSVRTARWNGCYRRVLAPWFVLVRGARSSPLNATSLIAEAARVGIGVAYLCEGFVAEGLAAGRMVRVLPDWTVPMTSLGLYYPGRRHVA